MNTCSANNPPLSKTKIRYAVLALFILQGLCFASWASRLTDLKSSFSIEDFLRFGILLTLQPIGKFLAIPIAGLLLQKIGSKNTVTISLGGFITSLLCIGLTDNIYFLGLFFMLFGVFWNMTDISLNTQAIEVERLYGRTIIAQFHAGWSIAACLGALLGFLMTNLNIDPHIHFIGISTICLLLLGYFRGFLLADSHIAKAQESEVITDNKNNPNSSYKRELLKDKPTMLIIIQLGLVWLFALIIENTMFDWSNIYFEETIKAPKSMQIGFLVFMMMMTIGRLLANYAYRIWSKTTVLIIAGILIFCGFSTSSIITVAISSLSAKVIINSAGFMLIGLGISCIVPTIYSIVGEKITLIPVSTALPIMAAISFAGPLVTNILVGYIANEWSLQWAYFSIGIFGLCIASIVLCSKSLKK